MRPQPMTATHDVMTCPACGDTITATVHVTPVLGKPTLAEGSKVNLDVTASLDRFHINHVCHGRVDPEPGAPE